MLQVSDKVHAKCETLLAQVRMLILLWYNLVFLVVYRKRGIYVGIHGDLNNIRLLPNILLLDGRLTVLNEIYLTHKFCSFTSEFFVNELLLLRRSCNICLLLISRIYSKSFICYSWIGYLRTVFLWTSNCTRHFKYPKSLHCCE